MLHVGLDLHKRFSTVATMDEDGNIVREDKLYHDDRGRLTEFFGDLAGNAVVTVEATRNWYWLYELPEEQGVEVKLAHTRKVRLIAEAKLKNDKIDARTLARLELTRFLPEAYIPSREVSVTLNIFRVACGGSTTRARLQRPVQVDFKRFHERWRAERTAGPGAVAEPLQSLAIFLFVQPLGPVSNALQPAVSVRQHGVHPAPGMAGGAAPEIVLCLADQPGPHRVLLNIPYCDQGVCRIHRTGVEPLLPEPAAPTLDQVHVSGVQTVGRLKNRRQGGLLFRYHYQMHMVGHQAVGEDFGVVAHGVAVNQVNELPAVGVREEHVFSPIAPLSDMMRDSSNNGPSDSGHTPDYQTPHEGQGKCLASPISFYPSVRSVGPAPRTHPHCPPARAGPVRRPVPAAVTGRPGAVCLRPSVKT